MKPHITLITGSARPENYTIKAAKLVEDELKKHEKYTFELIDARDLTLPLPGTSYENSSHDLLQEKVKNSTGIILASPEFSRQLGYYPSDLQDLFGPNGLIAFAFA